MLTGKNKSVADPGFSQGGGGSPTLREGGAGIKFN